MEDNMIEVPPHVPEINSTFVELHKIGFFWERLPETLFNELQLETQRMIKCKFQGYAPYNNQLVGQIENEYRLDKHHDELLDFLSSMIPKYLNSFQNKPKDGSYIPRFQISKKNGYKPDIWVNFQKKYEVNPPHIHESHLSFVIWVNIPFSIEEELKLPHIKNVNNINYNNTPGGFNFLFANPLAGGSITAYTIPPSKDFVGSAILFPSWLTHHVMPFYTSDEYRVSIAGNLILDTI